MTIDMGKCAYLGCFDLCKNRNDLVAIECANSLSIDGNTFTHVIISRWYYAKIKSNNKKLLDRLIKAFCFQVDKPFIEEHKNHKDSAKRVGTPRYWWINFEEYKQLQRTDKKYPHVIPTYIRNLESMTYEEAIGELQDQRDDLDFYAKIYTNRSDLARVLSTQNAVSQPESTNSSTVDTAQILEQELSDEQKLSEEAKTNILNWYKLGFLEKGSKLRSTHGPLYNCFGNFCEAAQSDTKENIDWTVKEIINLYKTALESKSDTIKYLNKLCGISNEEEIPKKYSINNIFRSLRKRSKKSKETGGTQKRTQSKKSSNPQSKRRSFKNLFSRSSTSID